MRAPPADNVGLRQNAWRTGAFLLIGELSNLEALETRERLKWAFRFRRRLIIGLLAVYALAVVGNLMPARLAVLAFFIVFLGINELREWLFRHDRIDERSSAPTVLLEVCAVAAIIYATGGHESPLLPLAALQVVGISTFVGYELAWITAYLSVAVFSLLNLLELWGVLPHSPLMPRSPEGSFRFFALASVAYGVMCSLAAYSSGYINSKMKVREDMLARANFIQTALAKLSGSLLGELSLTHAGEILTDWLVADLGYKRAVMELDPPGHPPLKHQSPACAVSDEELGRLLALRGAATQPACIEGWLHLPLSAGGQVMGWVLIECQQALAAEERAVLDTALNQFRTCLEKVTYHQDVLQLSILDGMTGIHNRRHFGEALKREVQRARRYAQPLALLLVDVDHFKRVNDQRGHLAGDAILKGLALRLKETVRTIDVVARYGGEEFVVIAPQTDMKSAITFGERLRKRIADEAFPYEDLSLIVTVSIGVAETLTDAVECEEELIRIADERLYQAKEGGRNRVVAA